MSSPPASSNGNSVNPGDEAFQNPYIPTSIPSEDGKEFKDYMKREYPYSIVTRTKQSPRPTNPARRGRHHSGNNTTIPAQ